MKKQNLLSATRLERVETIYLHALRVAGLLIATLCLIAALFFAGDAAWRFFVSTDVEPEATAVDSAVLAQQVVAPPSQGNSHNTNGPDLVKAQHDAFKKDFWPKYYAIYQRAYQQNRNTSDRLISSDDMLAVLRYDLDHYREAIADEDFEALSVRRMITDAAYQQAALSHVAQVMTATPVQAKLNAYKTATKSEQRCTTTPRTEYVARTCGYYYVYDCSFTRTVQDRRCEAVFPESVLTPAAAFERADAVFASAWLTDEQTKQEAANIKKADREITRMGIGPRVQMALMIIGGFFTVMFFFLLVAIERHLRPNKNKPTDPVA